MPPYSAPHRLTTRVLLVCAALASVHVLLHLATMPLLTLLAPLSPPLYALGAGIHSAMPFLARRLTRVPGTAVLSAALASLFVATTSPSGVILVVPLVLAGSIIDLVLWRSSTSEIRYGIAAVAAGAALFALSLTVFSPHHLTPFILVSTLLARVAGELAAALLSRVIAATLRRAGVGRTPQRSSPSQGSIRSRSQGSGD